MQAGHGRVGQDLFDLLVRLEQLTVELPRFEDVALRSTTAIRDDVRRIAEHFRSLSARAPKARVFELGLAKCAHLLRVELEIGETS